MLEVAARLQHRLARVHPFKNGNGPHARLISDIFLYSRDSALPEWLQTQLMSPTADPFCKNWPPREIRREAYRHVDRQEYCKADFKIGSYGGKCPLQANSSGSFRLMIPLFSAKPTS
ncbi:Fic family protein [Nitrospira sp. Nam80]